MCLAVPAKVLERGEFTAKVESLGNILEVGIMLTPDVEVGQYVYVHSGQAIQVVDATAAQESLALWKELTTNAGDS